MDSAELETRLPRFDRGRILDTLRPYYKLSNSRAAFRLIWSWGWIAGAVAFAVGIGHWAAYIPALLIIPARQVGLFFLVHEAAHHRMFSRRTFSDRVVNLLAAFPIGVTVETYRAHHLQHHRNLNTDRDPDWLLHQTEFWRWPKPKGAALRMLARSAIGGYAHLWLALFKALSPWSRFRNLSRFDKGSFLALCAALVTCLTLCDGWVPFLLLWVVPQFTLTFLLHHLRTIAEHLLVPDTHELNASRTVVSSSVERFFVAPFGANFHLEHHLFPGVPAYHLGAVHRLLMQDASFQAKASLSSSYLGPSGFLGELLGSEPGQRPPLASSA